MQLGMTHIRLRFDDATDNEGAIDSYGATSSLSENTEYLNQADDSEPIGGVKGSYMNAHSDVDGGEPNDLRINAGALDTMAITAADNTGFMLSAEGYGTGDCRVTQVEIYNNNNVLVAHGNQKAFTYSYVSAENAGTWKIQTLFWDGTKAICNVTVAVQA